MSAAPTSPGPAPGRHRASPWFIAEGVLLVILGLAAAFLPGIAGIAAALVFGWVLIVSGVFGLVSIFASRDHAHIVFGAISALVAIVVGALIVWRPLIGAVALAIFIAVYLFIDSLALFGLATDQRRRHAKGWAWLIVAAVIDFLLALFVLAMGPLSDTVLLGFVIAIDLIVAGIALVTLGLAARRAA
jgi:uncharacterized membrane protein HdeD (DUF308 family)